jgi:hypothetical protein
VQVDLIIPKLKLSTSKVRALFNSQVSISLPPIFILFILTFFIIFYTHLNMKKKSPTLRILAFSLFIFFVLVIALNEGTKSIDRSTIITDTEKSSSSSQPQIDTSHCSTQREGNSCSQPIPLPLQKDSLDQSLQGPDPRIYEEYKSNQFLNLDQVVELIKSRNP